VVEGDDLEVDAPEGCFGPLRLGPVR